MTKRLLALRSCVEERVNSGSHLFRTVLDVLGRILGERCGPVAVVEGVVDWDEGLAQILA